MKKSQLRKKAKSKSAGWWQRKCDDLMQDIHKFMFKKCMNCGGPNEVGHHFITKSLSSFLRYDFDNLIPLCHSCHFRHHIQADPSVSAKIIAIKGRDWYDNIERVRRTPIKTGISYFQEIHAKFSAQLRELSAPN